MAREAALSARLKLDDSDVQKKIRAQNTHYQSLISQNKRYKDRIAADNEAARKKEEIREQLAARKQVAREREKFAKWQAQNAAATAEKVKRWKKEQELETVLQAHPVAQRMASSRAINVWSRGDGGKGGKGGKGNTVQGGASNAGMAMLMFSQGLEDAQYGLKGVLNNIPPLVMAMGGSAGLAGTVSIAAVALTQLTKVFAKLNQEQELAEGNAKRFAHFTARTTKAAQDAEDAGQSQAEAYQTQFRMMDQQREYQTAELARKEKLAAAERDIQMAQLERLNGAERMQKEHELTTKAERERVAAEEALATRQLNVDNRKLEEIKRAQTEALEMLKQYEEMKALAEKTATRVNAEVDAKAANIMRDKRESFLQRFGEGIGTMVGFDFAKNLRDSMGNAAVAWSPKDEAGLSKLRAFTQANAGNITTADARARNSEGRAADVAVDRKALDLSDKAAEIRIANAAAEEFNETLRKNFEQGAEFGQLVGKVFRKLSGDFSALLRKTREQAQARNSFEGNLKVQELRQRGQNRAADRLERKNFMDSRPGQLQKEFGMPAADAQKAAEREWNVQHPDRAGTIRGARQSEAIGFGGLDDAKNAPSALDWAKRGTYARVLKQREILNQQDKNPGKLMPRTEGPATFEGDTGVKAVKKNAPAAAAGFQAAAGQEVGQLLRNIYEVLREKLSPPGPVANQLKPVNAP